MIKKKAVCSSKKTPTLRIVEVECWLWRHKEFLRIYTEGMDRVWDVCVQNGLLLNV